MPKDKLSKNLKNQSGYIALSSVLVISALVLIISVTVSLLSISEGQMAVAEKRREEVVNFVESCVEEALLRSSEDANFCDAGSGASCDFTLPLGTCTITMTKNGSWTMVAQGAVEDYLKKIQVEFTRGSSIEIISWQEIE